MENIRRLRRLRELPLHLMLLPSVIIVLIYSYGPILGSYMAFQKYKPVYGLFGSPWVGLENFRFLLGIPGSLQILWNTIYIAFFKIIGMIIVPVIFALLLNEVGKSKIKRIIQTTIYLPNFISWVILSGILIEILSPSEGVVNQLLGMVGIQPVYFLGDKFWFPVTIIVTDVLKQQSFWSCLQAIKGINMRMLLACAGASCLWVSEAA